MTARTRAKRARDDRLSAVMLPSPEAARLIGHGIGGSHSPALT